MRDLKEHIQDILDQHVAGGVVETSSALSVPGQKLLLLTCGIADKFKKARLRPDHTFRIASCTKTFIAAGLQLLVEDGKVNFEEPITR